MTRYSRESGSLRDPSLSRCRPAGERAPDVIGAALRADTVPRHAVARGRPLRSELAQTDTGRYVKVRLLRQQPADNLSTITG